jgi:hypothetical protein
LWGLLRQLLDLRERSSTQQCRDGWALGLRPCIVPQAHSNQQQQGGAAQLAPSCCWWRLPPPAAALFALLLMLPPCCCCPLPPAAALFPLLLLLPSSSCCCCCRLPPAATGLGHSQQPPHPSPPWYGGQYCEEAGRMAARKAPLAGGVHIIPPRWRWCAHHQALGWVDSICLEPD